MDVKAHVPKSIRLWYFFLTTPLVYLFYLLLLFSSCKHKYSVGYYQTINSKEFHDSVSLSFVGDKDFYLDSSSLMTSNSVQLFSLKDSIRLLSVMNPLETEIEIYDYSTGKIRSKVPLFKDGINSTDSGYGSLVQFVINNDSIFLCNQQKNKGFLLDWTGKVIRRYGIADSFRANLDQCVPRSNTTKPISYHDGKMFMTGTWGNPHVIDNSQFHIVVSLELQTGKVYRELPKPALYNEGNWGSNYLFMNVFSTYNPDNHHNIYSFAADPFLYEMIDTVPINIIRRHYAGSGNFRSIQAPWSDRTVRIDYQKSVKFDFTTPGYYSIVYDQFNKLYYRNAFLGLSESEFEKPEMRFNRQQTIIILNSNFEKVGEFLLPRYKYVFNNFFVTKEGLHFLYKPKFQPERQVMRYAIFRPKKNV